MYNSSALSKTTEWTATTTPAQAYAHPIDGIALDYTPAATTATTSAIGYTGGAAHSSSTAAADSGAGKIRGRELRAGVVGALVVAGVVGFLL